MSSNLPSNPQSVQISSIFFLIPLETNIRKTSFVASSSPSNLHGSESRNEHSSPGRFLMKKYNPFAKRTRKRFINKQSNPSVNFTELPRNVLDFDDELVENEKEEEKGLGLMLSPEVERTGRSYTRKSSLSRTQRYGSENSPFGPRKSVGRLSQRIDYEGISTVDLIKKLEKELQDTRTLHFKTESEASKLKERLEQLGLQSIEPGKPGTQKLEVTLKQQLEKKVDFLTANEERMESIEDKLILLDRAKELEEILRSQEESWEKTKYAKLGNREQIKRYINEVMFCYTFRELMKE